MNGWQISTIDMQPKSYLCLIGFFQGQFGKPGFKLVTLKGKCGDFMVLPNESSSGAWGVDGNGCGDGGDGGDTLFLFVWTNSELRTVQAINLVFVPFFQQ